MHQHWRLWRRDTALLAALWLTGSAGAVFMWQGLWAALAYMGLLMGTLHLVEGILHRSIPHQVEHREEHPWP